MLVIPLGDFDMASAVDTHLLSFGIVGFFPRELFKLVAPVK